jgi:glycosyltransferase involved in cell wall biosynthesis
MERGLRSREKVKSSTPGHPLVTVITVVLNGADYLEQTIRSVLDQSYDNIEYIIIDGGSTDATLDIIRKYEDQIDYWVSEPDTGIYDAMNKGIALACGELIALLNSGDYYEEEGIALAITDYRRHGTQGIYFGHSYIIQEDLGLRYQYFAHSDYWRGMGFCHPAMFAHQQVYHDIGKYDLTYRLAADYDFILRALDQNIDFIPIDAFIVNYRNTGLSARNLADSLTEMRKINGMHFGFFSLDHFKFLLVYIKSMLLILLQPLIRRITGEKILLKLKFLYTRVFLSKNKEL